MKNRYPAVLIILAASLTGFAQVAPDKTKSAPSQAPATNQGPVATQAPAAQGGSGQSAAAPAGTPTATKKPDKAAAYYH
jgi:hypothetical protein